ncbi:MAG TPA: hypothetical protein VEU47_19115 [Candidatus Cybelea sp.]|nr:hypothetical protein [Candidatus Cybelea sp.]
MSTPTNDLDSQVVKLGLNRRLAHQVLFKHRHGDETPEFHYELIDDFHSRMIRALCQLAFRGSAKSSIAEEGVSILSVYRDFRHALLVGSSLDKACERLHSVRRQFEKNAMLIQLYGNLVGRPWGDEKIETSTGITIQAMGRNQAIRGTKNEDYRPDFILADDIEDAESVRTPEGRDKVQGWFFGELLPSGDEPNLRVRVLANDMHPECLANRLKNPDSGFVVKTYPIEYKDLSTGERRATWPARYPLEWIDAQKKRLYSVGRGAEWQSNYMCNSTAPETKPFKKEMFRVEPQPKSWQAVYCIFDPARTVSATAAHTGFVAATWLANRLLVWDAWGRFLLPDQIVDAVFAANEEHDPVKIGFEEDGLNQWALQPIRQRAMRQGIVLPLQPLKAPKGKGDFIRGLQPFFTAREIVFAKPLPDLEQGLLSFPSGRIDVPNALAYMQKIRPGAPIYDEFTEQNISESLALQGRETAWLCLNATNSIVTAQLVQFTQGTLRVFNDWVREGEPAVILPDMIKEANLEANRTCRLVAPPIHFDRFNNVGLAAAVQRSRLDIRSGTAEDQGRAGLRGLLQGRAGQHPALLVAHRAGWTCRAFAGGYARALLKQGGLAEFAEDGPYRVLMEGLESFAGSIASLSTSGSDSAINWRTTADGRKYVSALKGR